MLLCSARGEAARRVPSATHSDSATAANPLMKLLRMRPTQHSITGGGGLSPSEPIPDFGLRRRGGRHKTAGLTCSLPATAIASATSAMLFVFLLKGIAVGFVIAVPVGPVGVLCVRRTIFEGRLVGFLSGLGAASADTIFGIVAG